MSTLSFMGPVTHFYPRISVAIIKLARSLNLKDRLHFLGPRTDFEESVDSMQLNHKNIIEGKKGQEIGVKVMIQPVHAGDNVYKAAEKTGDRRVKTLIDLTTELIAEEALKSKNLINAFKKVDRKYFVPSHLVDSAYDDDALPIGEDQTISQPYTVAFMLELLKPGKGQHIMDIGSGSCWQSALLAEAVGKYGKIYAIERVPALYEFGRRNLCRYPALNRRIELFCEDATPGLSAVAGKIGKFDGIIAAAELTEVPSAWREQLKIGGRLVYPKGGSVFLEIKTGRHDFDVTERPGFAFVPFVQDDILVP